jgi:hypothetical protein
MGYGALPRPGTTSATSSRDFERVDAITSPRSAPPVDRGEVLWGSDDMGFKPPTEEPAGIVWDIAASGGHEAGRLCPHSCGNLSTSA